MKTFNVKSKAQTLDWENAQEVRQQRKQHKQFRQQRQSRKGCWQSAE